MKKLILAAFVAAFSLSASAQKVTKDSKGNFIQVSTAARVKAEPVATGQTFTDTKGKSYPVYKGSRGGLFYMTVNKNGEQVKKYIKQ